jgi:hypothetical protein
LRADATTSLASGSARACFVAPASEEFLAEAAYYNPVQPGQGMRLATTV